MDHVPPSCSARERAASRADRSLPLRWGDRGTCVQRPDPRPLAGGCRVSRMERAPSPGGALLNGRVQWRALHRTHLLGPSRAELGPARVFWSPAALKPQTRSSWPCPNHFSFAGFHSKILSRFTFFYIAELFYTCRLHFQARLLVPVPELYPELQATRDRRQRGSRGSGSGSASHTRFLRAGHGRGKQGAFFTVSRECASGACVSGACGAAFTVHFLGAVPKHLHISDESM